MSNSASQDGLVIENMAPIRGESKLYSYIEGDPARRGYAVISLLDNLFGDGRVLLVQGTTALGDGMAAEFLESGTDLTPILDEAKSDAEVGQVLILK